MSEQRYLVTARKYRPQRFEEIVAQGHVSGTLKNAITLDRLAHAYLFSGPRGVGKTTAARILAKAINCTLPLADRDSGEPCRTCESCQTFEEGRSLNIIEIDAASNNRVEDIRELRDTVLIPPQGSRKKVYIIDEVHMLSNAAFNALLKTLEEPPPYALFIFATTEPNKVLPTILSRCQRFDFRRIAVPEIVSHLEEICTTENIEADEASLMLIAQKGDGALRDSLSAFDQAVSLCGTSLKYPDLAQAFGVVDVELFFEVTQHILAGNSGGLLLMVDRIIRQGYDLQEFLIGLSSHLRNLLVACTMQDTSLIEVAVAVRKRYAEESKHHTETNLLRLLMIVADGEDNLKTSAQPRLQLELTLLKMAAMAHAVDLKTALAKLDKLEADVSQGKLHVSDATEAPAVTSKPAQKVVARVVVSDAASTPSPETPAGAVTGLTSPPAPEATPLTVRNTGDAPSGKDKASEDINPHAPTPEETASGHITPDEEPVSPAHVTLTPGTSSGGSTEKTPTTPPAESIAPGSNYQGLFGAPALRKVQTPNKPADDASAAADGDVIVAEAPSSELDEITQIWPEFLKHVQTERIHVSALLQHARPIKIHEETLVLSVPDEFHKRMLANQQDFLLDHLCNFVMVPIERANFVIDMIGSDALLKQEVTPAIDPHEYMQKKRDESPIVRAIFDEFGGEMVW